MGLYCPLRGEPVIDEDYWFKELTTFKSAYPKVKPDVKPIPFLSPFNQKAGDLRNPFERKY